MRSATYQFEEFRVEPDQRAIFRGEERVALTPKVFDLLLIFIESPGEVLEKKELMDRLWPDSFVEEANLTQNVAVLRKALGDDSKPNRIILTVPGRGYRFIAKVKELDLAKNIEATGREPGNVEPVSDWKESRAVGVAAAGTAILAIALIFVVWWFAGQSSASTADVSRTVQLTAWSGLDLYPAISPDGSSIAFSSDRTGTFEIYVRQLVTGAREVQLTTDGAQNFQPSFSPDGSRIAYSSKLRGGIWVVPSTGGDARQLTQFGSRPAWSPDGTQIAFQSDPLNDLGSRVRNAMPPSTLWIVPATGGQPQQLTQPGKPLGGHGAPSWSPDGKRIVFDVNDWGSSELYSLSLDDRIVTHLEVGTHAASDPIYASDGRSVYFILDTGSALQNVPIAPSGKATGKPTSVFDASGARIRHAALDRSGKRLVYAALTTTSNVWVNSIGDSSADRTPVPLTKHAHTRTTMPTFSPNGRTIAFQSFTVGTLAHLWLMNADGSDQRQLSSRPGFSPVWSQDGSLIWFVSLNGRRSDMWSIDPATGLERKLFDFDEEALNARPSPDGSVVAFNSQRSGALNMWLIPMTGGEVKQITYDNEFAAFPAWSPDGQWIAYQLKRGEDTHVAIVPAGGGEPVQLTNERGQAWVNAWSADGDKVIYAGQRNGIWNVYAVSRRTREITQLTNFTKLNTYVRYPAVSPRFDKVAYEFAETTGNIWMAELK